MKFNKEILIIALVMSILDVIMMGLIRKYYLSTQIVKYILPVGMIIYMFQPILFYKALFFEGIGVFNIVWNSVSNLLILFTGIYFFKERLNLRRYIGVLLSFISIYLLTTTY